MAKGYRQLSLYDRQDIERGLDEGRSFKEIAGAIGRATSTVSREVAQNATRPGGKSTRFPCGMRASCARTGICGGGCLEPLSLCRDCRRRDCRESCGDYARQTACDRLARPPHVCNGCPRVRRGCHRPSRVVYDARRADGLARARRSESREGVDMEEGRFRAACDVIRGALRRGLSPYEISVTHDGALGVSPSTIYRWVGAGYGGLMSIDLERKVRFKPRRRRAPKRTTSHPERRSHDSYLGLPEEVREGRCEMDTVVGRAVDRQAVLTLYLVSCHLQLALLLREKTCAEVMRALWALRRAAGDDLFRRLFGCVLTDNGEEFRDEGAIGRVLGEEGPSDVRLFYCDPRQSQQKGGCEKNHTELRQILRKGLFAFDELDEGDLAVVMSHANSNPRRSLGDRTPIEVFLFLYGEEGRALLDALGVEAVDPAELVLKPEILDRERRARGKGPLTRLR